MIHLIDPELTLLTTLQAVPAAFLAEGLFCGHIVLAARKPASFNHNIMTILEFQNLELGQVINSGSSKAQYSHIHVLDSISFLTVNPLFAQSNLRKIIQHAFHPHHRPHAPGHS